MKKESFFFQASIVLLVLASVHGRPGQTKNDATMDPQVPLIKHDTFKFVTDGLVAPRIRLLNRGNKKILKFQEFSTGGDGGVTTSTTPETATMESTTVDSKLVERKDINLPEESINSLFKEGSLASMNGTFKDMQILSKLLSRFIAQLPIAMEDLDMDSDFTDSENSNGGSSSTRSSCQQKGGYVTCRKVTIFGRHGNPLLTAKNSTAEEEKADFFAENFFDDSDDDLESTDDIMTSEDDYEKYSENNEDTRPYRQQQDRYNRPNKNQKQQSYEHGSPSNRDDAASSIYDDEESTEYEADKIDNNSDIIDDFFDSDDFEVDTKSAFKSDFWNRHMNPRNDRWHLESPHRLTRMPPFMSPLLFSPLRPLQSSDDYGTYNRRRSSPSQHKRYNRDKNRSYDEVEEDNDDIDNSDDVRYSNRRSNSNKNRYSYEDDAENRSISKRKLYKSAPRRRENRDERESKQVEKDRKVKWDSNERKKQKESYWNIYYGNE